MEAEVNMHALHERAREVVAEVLGIEDTTAFDLAKLLHHIGNLMERVTECAMDDDTLSNARLRLLVPLLIAERLGHPAEISPTMLSRYSNVSRNTISALLRGLEEQGLVTREVDADDRRRFHIRLTPLGREVAMERAPRFVAHTESLFADLTADERETLLRLLTKVRDTLVSKCVAMGSR